MVRADVDPKWSWKLGDPDAKPSEEFRSLFMDLKPCPKCGTPNGLIYCPKCHGVPDR